MNEDADNSWTPSTKSKPFWKEKGPIEVSLGDRSVVLEHPKKARAEYEGLVIAWRKVPAALWAMR